VLWPRVILGVALIVTGAVWIGQGAGAVHGSFMTGHAEWAVAGGVAIFFGLALLVGARRSRRSRME
jgi:hypothetical protein